MGDSRSQTGPYPRHRGRCHWQPIPKERKFPGSGRCGSSYAANNDSTRVAFKSQAAFRFETQARYFLVWSPALRSLPPRPPRDASEKHPGRRAQPLQFLGVSRGGDVEQRGLGAAGLAAASRDSDVGGGARGRDVRGGAEQLSLLGRRFIQKARTLRGRPSALALRRPWRRGRRGAELVLRAR